jgi:hypothetical protein
MDISRRVLTADAIGALATTTMARPGWAQSDSIADSLLGRTDFWTALDAYTYAYSLVTMEYTRRVLTNVVEPKGTKAPMGQLGRLRE